ncbi:MAG TPA: cytochrome c3 family protein [Desulfuromonadales bacterium]|nr:cytochrome c3 family protein [Desulfuromonadales bacterium]
MTPILKSTLLAGVLLSVWLFSTANAEGPEKFDLPAPAMGTVSFQHELHQERVADCETCHHKGVETGACLECHEISKSAPQGKDLFHQVCRNCHQEQGGPTACAGCHTRPAQ